MKSSKRATIIAILAIAVAIASSAVFAESASAKSGDWGIVIDKKSITSTATFFPYKANGLAMEIIAVKASDGSIRTALNTCQVCYQSGRGYYKQVGDVFVCQNCGNRFKVDQVEKQKGGCNPVPILEGEKADLGASIGISKQYLASVAPYFARWKKN